MLDKQLSFPRMSLTTASSPWRVLAITSCTSQSDRIFLAVNDCSGAGRSESCRPALGLELPVVAMFQQSVSIYRSPQLTNWVPSPQLANFEYKWPTLHWNAWPGSNRNRWPVWNGTSGSLLELELTPFHGHLIVLAEGVRDAQSQTAVPGAIS